MNLNDFALLGTLKNEWDVLQPLTSEHGDRLWRKLRLEWDYHSNHIEGNTLTYGETELLLVFGQTRGTHSIREYEEMKAHDVAINHIRELATQERHLTEVDVRELNQLILKEPFWKAAITSEGRETRKRIIPGQYKAQPNNVLTPTGEIFNFVDPLDVSQRMFDYMRLLNSAPPDLPDILVHLARVHHEFVSIHPFDDGNGRVGRLLLNYVLLKYGYPPIIIRTEEKRAYLYALNRADVAQRDYSELAAFLAESLKYSLELGLKAAKGEKIEEPSDLQKEVALFAKETQMSSDEINKRDSYLKELWKISLGPLFKRFAEGVHVFRPLFESIEIDGPRFLVTWQEQLDIAVSSPEQNGFKLNITFKDYTKESTRKFSYYSQLSVNLASNRYSLHSDELGTFFEQFYNRQISTQEIEEIAEKLLREIFLRIKSQASR